MSVDVEKKVMDIVVPDYVKEAIADNHYVEVRASVSTIAANPQVMWQGRKLNSIAWESIHYESDFIMQDFKDRVVAVKKKYRGKNWLDGNWEIGKLEE